METKKTDADLKQNVPEITLLTAQDVANALQISDAMAYLLLQRGHIKTVRIGRIVRVRPADLDEFIQHSVSL